MASKPSKKTLALLAQFPCFDDWIVENLSASQLIRLTQCGDPKDLGEEHPLRSEELGVSLWRAYKSEVLFELKCRWPEGDFDLAQGPNRHAWIPVWVCMAIALYATAQPELVDRVLARQRREIADACSPAQTGTEISKETARRNRL